MLQPSYGQQSHIAVPLTRDLAHGQLWQARRSLTILSIGDFDPKFRATARYAIEAAIKKAEAAIELLPDHPVDITQDEHGRKAEEAINATRLVLKVTFQGPAYEEFSRTSLVIMSGSQLMYRSPAELRKMFTAAGADDRTSKAFDAAVAKSFDRIRSLDRAFNGGKPVVDPRGGKEYVDLQALMQSYTISVQDVLIDGFIEARGVLALEGKKRLDDAILTDHKVH
jgi:hypothetical protein